jgi:sodium transport system permease protein
MTARFRIIAAIARKELLESFRDRKSLALMILLPVLLYPGLILLVTQVAAVQQQSLESQPSRVQIVGADSDHPIVQALQDHPDLAVTVEPEPGPEHRAALLRVYPGSAPENAEDEGSPALGDATPEGSGAEGSASAELVAIELDTAERTLGAQFPDANLIVDLTAWPAELNELPARVALTYRSIDDASRQATERVEEVLTTWSDDETRRRLDEAGLPWAVVQPVEASRHDMANTGQRGGFLLGSLLPLFIIMTVMIGAMYPAIDLTAGERERGSIQTLFTAPVTAVEILAGKYITVVLIALTSGLANLISIGLVFSQGMMLEPELAQTLDLSLDLTDLAGLLVCVVLVAILLAAVLLAVSAVAPSFKEAQSYVTPVYLLCMVPAMLAQMPGFEFNATLALIPAVNIVVLMKQMLVEGIQLSSLLPVATSTLVYAAMILVAASRMFADEALVTGAGRGFGLLLPRRDIRPARWPESGDAIMAFALAFVAMYYVGAVIQSRAPRLGLVVTLWGVLLLPTLAMARRLKLSFRDTFKLRMPRSDAWAAATLLGLGSVAVVSVGVSLVESTFLPMSPEMKAEMARQMAEFFPTPTNAIEWMSILFIGAISPAICEELLFRGFILQGLRTSLRPWVAIAVTALLFGVLHMSIYRLAGTTALGVLMGILVWRSGSILPAMWFHALNNAIALAVGFLVPDNPGASWTSMLPVALPGVIAFAVGLFLLGRMQPPADDGPVLGTRRSGPPNPVATSA